MALFREPTWGQCGFVSRELHISTDTNVETIYGDQKGARKGYNPKKRGKRGYRPWKLKPFKYNSCLY